CALDSAGKGRAGDGRQHKGGDKGAHENPQSISKAFYPVTPLSQMRYAHVANLQGFQAARHLKC
ncbi:MAG TPA: hypothetical protein VGM26_11420, partial [Rhizomicrobium sp.]